MEKKRTRNLTNAHFAWIGYPDDLGVKNVNGRPGAKEGPARFELFFKKLNGKSPIFDRCIEGKSVPMGDALDTNYEASLRATQSTFTRLNFKTDALIAVGGGHDYAYVWLRAIYESLPKGTRLGCINIDAHFDLRSSTPVMTSGSPFRRLIEEKCLDPSRFVEFGIQAHCNSPDLWEYAKAKKISVVPFEKLRNGKAVPEFKKALASLRKKCDVVLISLDLDALSFAHAPGVSAPQAEGFTGSEVFQMLEFAGSDKKVTSLGIFELCPNVDLHDLTARLAAQGAWHFLSRKLF